MPNGPGNKIFVSMNILVTGANGQLGTEMRNISAGAPDRYIFTDVTSPSVPSIRIGPS